MQHDFLPPTLSLPSQMLLGVKGLEAGPALLRQHVDFQRTSWLISACLPEMGRVASQGLPPGWYLCVGSAQLRSGANLYFLRDSALL